MDISKYIENFIKIDNPVLERLTKEYEQRVDISPCIGLQTGRFVSWLIKLTNAKKVLELGTCIGYSTVTLAEAVKNNKGKLTAIEISPNHCNETTKNLQEAGLIQYVNLIHGDGSKELEKLEGEFDLILQDSLKVLYPSMLEECIKKTKTGGIIIADDTLFHPLGKKEKFSKPMDEYNKLVFADSRLESTILPIGDGLTISIKK